MFLGARKAPQQIQGQAERGIRDAVVQYVGRVGDDHAATLRFVQVDAVNADAEVRDYLERGQPREQLARHRQEARYPAHARAHLVEQPLAIGRVEIAVAMEFALELREGRREKGRDDQDLGSRFSHASAPAIQL